MEFSNPFDNPQGQFYILQNPNVSLAFGRSSARFLLAGPSHANRNPGKPASNGSRKTGPR